MPPLHVSIYIPFFGGNGYITDCILCIYVVYVYNLYGLQAYSPGLSKPAGLKKLSTCMVNPGIFPLSDLKNVN